MLLQGLAGFGPRCSGAAARGELGNRRPANAILRYLDNQRRFDHQTELATHTQTSGPVS